MEEQPRTDPPRRVPAKATPRSRAAKPKFTPPVDTGAEATATDPAGGSDPAVNWEADATRTPAAGSTTSPPRARRPRAKPAPTVLFQPPDAEPATPESDPGHPAPPPPTPPARKRTTAAKRPEPAKKVSPGRRAAVARSTEDVPPTAPRPRRTARSSTPAQQPAQEPGQPEPEQQVALDQQAQAEQKREPEAASGRTPGVSEAPTAAQLLDHPGHAPELLALAAVARIGPRARSWAERMRTTYPAATPDGLARLATRRFGQLAAVGGAMSAVAGLLAPLAELTAVAWTQAGLVLHLAAAHGRDPGHPDRAAELLVLTQVQPDLETAGAALEAARVALGGVPGPPHRLAEAGWRLAAPLAAQAGGWLALRLAARLVPGAAVLAAAAGNSAVVERLAARAVTFYRQPADAGRTMPLDVG